MHDILDDKLTGRNDRLTYRTLNRTNYGPLLDLKNSAGAQHALPHARVHTHTHSHTHTIHTNTHTHTHTHTHRLGQRDTWRVEGPQGVPPRGC